MADMPGMPTYQGPTIAGGTAMNRMGFRPELFVEGLNQVFGLGVETVESRISQAYHQMTSQKAFEQMLSMAGIGYFERLNEGQPVHYQQIESRYKSTFYHLDYATGLRFTKRVKRDLLYFQIDEAASQFGMAAAATREVLAANLFNTGDTVVWNAEENLPLFHAAHPLSQRSVDLSTYGNLIAADPDYTSLQDGILLMDQTVNDMSYQMHLKSQVLLFHSSKQFLVDKWMNSPGEWWNANNAKNTLRGRLTPVMWDYLDPDIMLIRGNTFRTYWFDRDPLDTASDEDFDTGDTKYKASFSCSNGASDWRGWVMIKGS